MRTSFRQQLMRYGLVGVANTLISVSVIVALTFLGADAVLANVVGFGAGLVNSYLLNGRYTFQANGMRLWQFAVAFAIAYALNLSVLIASRPLAGINILLPQAVAILSYNVVFFILMKLWVFADTASQASER